MVCFMTKKIKSFFEKLIINSNRTSFVDTNADGRIILHELCTWRIICVGRWFAELTDYPKQTIGTSPNVALVNSMLDQAVATLKNGEKPIVHSDRGCHYRWLGWIDRMEYTGLTRSMSEKGCSPDNAACEGFFGHLKNEMFYNRSWQGVSTKEFIAILNDYLIWYREKLKLSLGGLSPMEYRRSLGLIWTRYSSGMSSKVCKLFCLT